MKKIWKNLPKSIDKSWKLWYNNYRKLRKEVITMRETYYINGKEKLHGNYVNGKRQGYFTLQLRNGGVAVVEYNNGKSKYNYFMVTMPDGTQEKRPLSEIQELLQ